MNPLDQLQEAELRSDWSELVRRPAPGSAVSVVSPEPELTREYPDLTVTTDAAIPRLAIDLQPCVAAVIDVPAPPARRRRKVAQ